MNAQELAAKFTAKIALAALEKDRQTEIAADNVGKRTSSTARGPWNSMCFHS
jgi:hypothetical protein